VKVEVEARVEVEVEVRFRTQVLTQLPRQASPHSLALPVRLRRVLRGVNWAARRCGSRSDGSGLACYDDSPYGLCLSLGFGLSDEVDAGGEMGNVVRARAEGHGAASGGVDESR
jgi:hypothetical protein